MPTRTPSILAAVLALAACGSGGTTTAEPSLRDAGDVAAERFVTTPLGKGADVTVPPLVTVEGQEPPEVVLRALVTGFTVGGDDAGPWLAAEVRAENPNGDAQAFPTFAIVCAGGTEAGGYQAGSTVMFGDPLPPRSFKEGIVHLLLPGDARTGTGVPECAAPAYVRAFASENAGGGQWPVPGDVLAALNAKRGR